MTPLPINVQHLPPPDSLAWAALWVSIALALVTGGLFLATRNMVAATRRLAHKTAEMATETAELARDTVQGTRVADRHHQESMSPLCVVRAVKCGRGGPFGSNDKLFGVIFKVQNMGLGPALLVNVDVTSVGPGLVEDGTKRGMLPYSLPAGETQEHKAAGFPPRENAMFLIEVQFLSIFNAWGVGKWNVWEGDGTYGLVSFDFPQPQERIGKTSPPGPLSSQNSAETIHAQQASGDAAEGGTVTEEEAQTTG